MFGASYRRTNPAMMRKNEEKKGESAYGKCVTKAFSHNQGKTGGYGGDSEQGGIVGTL